MQRSLGWGADWLVPLQPEHNGDAVRKGEGVSGEADDCVCHCSKPEQGSGCLKINTVSPKGKERQNSKKNGK